MVLNKFFAELTTMKGIIVVGLIYKRSVDKSTEKLIFVLEPLISSLDPRVKTYIMGTSTLTCWITIFHHQSKILSIK